MVEDKKGNIWTAGEVNSGGGIWTVSRYDQKSLYNKKPNVTEIMSRGPALLATLEASDGSVWIGASDGAYRYNGKTINDFRRKEDWRHSAQFRTGEI